MAARVHSDRQSDYSPTNLTGGDFILKIDFIDTSDIKKAAHILFFLTCMLVLRAYWRALLPSGRPLARTSSLRRWDTPPCSWGLAAVTIQRRETRGTGKTKEPPKIQNLHMHTAHFTSNSVRYLHEQCEYKRTISKTFFEDICKRLQQAVPFRTKQCVASQGTKPSTCYDDGTEAV